MEVPDDWFWIRTVGAPRKGDPRDGELHRMGSLPEFFNLEPWDDDPSGEEARYYRASEEPEVDDTGRQVWRFDFRPAP